MGKLAVYKYAAGSMLLIQVLLTVFTLLGLFGGDYTPAGNTAKAMTVYILPVLIIGNLVMFLYWLIRRKWHWAVLPLITLLCCIKYTGTYIQFRSDPSADETKPGIKIASYNVANFGRETSGFMAQDILSVMKEQRVDIFCIQEYTEDSGDKKNSDSYRNYFPYFVRGKDDMIIYSRYPITASKTMKFEMTNNSAMWANINVEGKIIRVFNVHLETTGINSTMHQAAKIAMNGGEVESSGLTNALFGNYTIGMIARAGQADQIAMERMQSNVPCIVCGDFNDVPYSYVYNQMLGDMVDGFKECGSGLMTTFRGKKSVRIDYIFHSESLQGQSYYKKELTYSDHYPVFMKIKVQ
jgi:endonuclease/exonuclease/phosphatase family metal-dependent hydrolase